MKSLYPRKRVTHVKTCAICEKTKTLVSFPIVKRLKAGKHMRHSYCNPCLSQYMLDRYHFLKNTK